MAATEIIATWATEADALLCPVLSPIADKCLRRGERSEAAIAFRATQQRFLSMSRNRFHTHGIRVPINKQRSTICLRGTDFARAPGSSHDLFRLLP